MVHGLFRAVSTGGSSPAGYTSTPPAAKETKSAKLRVMEEGGSKFVFEIEGGCAVVVSAYKSVRPGQTHLPCVVCIMVKSWTAESSLGDILFSTSREGVVDKVSGIWKITVGVELELVGVAAVSAPKSMISTSAGILVWRISFRRFLREREGCLRDHRSGEKRASGREEGTVGF